MTENKRYKLYDVGSGYMTSCGIESESGHCFENMTECCEELNRLSDENEQLKKELKNMTERFEYELKMKLKYHSELISDTTDGAVSDEKEQLELGKWHSEHGLSWEDDGDVE